MVQDFWRSVYISLNLFASHVNDFNNCNKFLTVKLLSRAIGIINFAKHFQKFYRRHYDMINALNSAFRYLDDLLNIDNIHFEQTVHRLHPSDLQLNKANASDTKAAFLNLTLSIHNYTVSTKIYDKRDDFDFDIVNYPFLDGDVPRRPSYGVLYISTYSLCQSIFAC